MIGRIQGILVEKTPPRVLVEVSGIGYEIDAPMSTFYVLPELGEKVILYTHFIVREDAQALYGFHRVAERDFFRRLIKINGVGPKLALGFLSGMSIEESITYIEQEDVIALTKLPGIGKKTAERLVIEMRDWLKSWQKPIGLNLYREGEQTVSQPTAAEMVVKDAESALVALGYKIHEAKKVVKQVQGEAKSSEDLIRMALKALA